MRRAARADEADGGYVAQLKFVLPAHVQALGVRWVFVVICVEINQ